MVIHFPKWEIKKEIHAERIIFKFVFAINKNLVQKLISNTFSFTLLVEYSRCIKNMKFA